jgi:GH35 family endo-1,4-beta-xylanase
MDMSEVQAVEEQLLSRAAASTERHRKADVTLGFRTSDGRPLAGLEVRAQQRTHDYLFGCIIFPLVRHGEGVPAERDEAFKRRFRDLFNFAVFPFYWAGYEHTQGMPNWQPILPVLEWCRAHGITTKGHPLAWSVPSGMPGWLEGMDPDVSAELLRSRIRNIVRGFAGRIDVWDVVNEAIHVPTWHSAMTAQWGRQAWRLNEDDAIPAIADYVEMAFRCAHEANPQAHLILNEYGCIAWRKDRQVFVRLIQELKGRGTPISGLGVQAHEPRHDWFAPQETLDTFDALAGLGYPVHVTEFMPQSGGRPIDGGWRTGTWDEQAQADFAEQFFRLTFGHPGTASINWWGLSDNDIWLPGGGLVDERMRPKPVYERLRKLIHEEWKTRTSAVTDAEGTAAFRGFLGQYDVTVTCPSGAVRRVDLHVRRDEANVRTFTLCG